MSHVAPTLGGVGPALSYVALALVGLCGPAVSYVAPAPVDGFSGSVTFPASTLLLSGESCHGVLRGSEVRTVRFRLHSE